MSSWTGVPDWGSPLGELEPWCAEHLGSQALVKAWPGWPRVMESGLAAADPHLYPWGWQDGDMRWYEHGQKTPDRPKAWALGILWFGDVFFMFLLTVKELERNSCLRQVAKYHPEFEDWNCSPTREGLALVAVTPRRISLIWVGSNNFPRTLWRAFVRIEVAFGLESVSLYVICTCICVYVCVCVPIGIGWYRYRR